MTTPRTNGTKSRRKATTHDYTHPLTKTAWKRLYDEMRAIVDVIEADCRYLDDTVAANLHDGIDDPSLEQQAKVTSALLDAASSLEDALYQIMYPELTETPKEGMGKYE